ncbi:CPBP family intramembrane glutamic endopeptidase [Clostridium sp. Cult3]|uniref:CPBP family intramembrane glutamic endopeptidase n=1 Tax=Clostridium sp. Cult3 TaxID=2079004 RepID=UPI001F3091DC|nr:type II CAAX endopeptidase family protein [Clostridium sp. Cult3]
MNSKGLIEEKTIYKVNSFYLGVVLWSILVQFLPIPTNSYQYIALLIPIGIYLFKNRDEAERILKPNLLNLKSVIIIFIIWFLMLPIIISIVELYTRLFGSTFPDIIAEDSHPSFIGNLFFTAITPAILEEMLMRGIILDGYRHKSRFVAALVNGLMFGMLHLNFFQFFHTFVAGFVASYLVFATNSIYAGIIVHFINNSFPIFMDYLSPPEPNVDYTSNPNLLAIIISITFSVAAISFLLKLLAKINGVELKKEYHISDEKILNKPLIRSIVLFVGFSTILVLAL